MIINAMVLLFNSVDMPVSGPYAGKWQVCSDCAPCNACIPCFCGNSECPDCFDGIANVSEKYIFWTFSARPGWACEYEPRPDCKTGNPTETCTRRAYINQNTGEEECCIVEVWEDQRVCGGVNPPGPDGPRTRKIKSMGPTPNGFFRKELAAPDGPHKCQCKPNSRCAWYDPVHYPEEPWQYRMPCTGMCDETCTGCDPFWLSCSYCWTGAYEALNNCNTDCTCQKPASGLERTNMVVSGSHVVGKSTRYTVGEWDPSGGSDQKWCEPKQIDWYPNDNGRDVNIGSAWGQLCADASPNAGGIGALEPAGEADENGEFVWRNMLFRGFDPKSQNCPGTKFYVITANVQCGAAFGTEGCRKGCINGMGPGGYGCGASGAFLYFARYDENGATFTQIGRETYSAGGPCSTSGLSYAEAERVGTANSKGGGIIHLSGGEILPSAPTYRGPAACSLSPTQIKFSCPLGV